jgi:hypothetical protein
VKGNKRRSLQRQPQIKCHALDGLRVHRLGLLQITGGETYLKGLSADKNYVNI